ncbi:asparaginase domain-containing protein [Shinella sp. G-2]|uniref:asparaginase domain-containing protein n=1 Tax=Shinella sp. G-2 TaxID=3133141 RepID=UPI003D0453EC
MNVKTELTARLDAGSRRSDVLLVHTGGTIGMGMTPSGLAPVAGLLERAVESYGSADMAVTVVSFDPLVDSADITHEHWNRIVALIEAWDGTGVIVTHGTDTMSFTGAALSQALSGLAIPVVLCGAMQPLGTGGDAEDNLKLALGATRHQPAGVWLAFAGRILPAAGLVKHHTHRADAFRAVLPVPQASERRFRRFGPVRLAVMTIAPGLSGEVLAAMLAALDGAVLRLFGAGTIPGEPALLAALQGAMARGCRLRAVSQCEQGGLSPGAYAAGAALWQIGVENGEAETPEAALIRLWLDLSHRDGSEPVRL